MIVLPMPPRSSARVHALYRACHPGWPALPEDHFLAYPTVIAYEFPEILGYASFSMNVSDAGDLSIMLSDSGVTPQNRGRGIARALLRHRVNIGRQMKAKCAVGMTQPDNDAMLKILRTEGFDEIRTIERAYADGKDGVLFILPLEPR